MSNNVMRTGSNVSSLLAERLPRSNSNLSQKTNKSIKSVSLSKLNSWIEKTRVDLLKDAA